MIRIQIIIVLLRPVGIICGVWTLLPPQLRSYRRLRGSWQQETGVTDLCVVDSSAVVHACKLNCI